MPAPEDLPAIALRQAGLYRLQVALLVFYGGLLLIVPAFSGLISGRLPTEISTRGAKFAEEADHSDEAAKAAIEELERTTSALAEAVANAHFKIEGLEEMSESDSTQPAVDLKQ